MEGKACEHCGRNRALIDDICDDCTIKLKGSLFPWLEFEPKKEIGDFNKEYLGDFSDGQQKE